MATVFEASKGPKSEGEEDGCEEEVDTDDDDEQGIELQPPPRMPSYPFPADFNLEVWGCPWPIQVCSHLCDTHPRGTRLVLICFPGVHGGVGPCRTPGETFDADALYPTVIRRLLEDPECGIDCYRCSWPFMRPPQSYAIRAAMRVLLYGLQQVSAGAPPTDEPGSAPRPLRVVIVGHSLGGYVAAQTAEVAAGFFGPDGRGTSDSGDFEGLDGLAVHIAGLCTLNGAIDPDRVPVPDGGRPFQNLCRCRALLISGDADEVVPPVASVSTFEVLPTTAKRHLRLPGGTHDLFGHKAEVVDELYRFILECRDSPFPSDIAT